MGLTGRARRIVGCACKPLPPWARGARRGGGGGSTHRDSGNALLALEGHPDPREGCESPVGAALAWTCRRGHARSLGSPSVSQPGSGLRLTHLHVGPAYLFICIRAPPSCSRLCSLAPDLPFSLSPFPSPFSSILPSPKSTLEITGWEH